MNVAPLLDCLASSLAWVVRSSWQASVVVALVLIAQAPLRGRVSARWRYGLWLLVVVRLILPALPATRFSPFNWLRIEAPAEAVASAEGPPPTRVGAIIPRRAPIVSLVAKPMIVAPQAKVQADEPVPAISPTNRHDMASAAGSDAPLPAVFTEPPIAAPAREPVAEPSSAPVSSPALRAAHIRPTSAIVSLPVVSPRPVISLRGAVAAIWAFGALIVAARVLWATGRLARVIRRLPEVRDPYVIEMVGECAARLGLRRCPQVLEAPEGTGPALAGVLRPRMLLPAAAMRGLGRNELRLVILHELVHLHRGDLLLNWLLSMLQAVHWFNPAVWFAFARLRADRELACDELVLSSSPSERRRDDCRDYGRAILKLLQPSRAGTVPGLAVGVLDGGGWARKAQLRRRITMIALFDRPAGRWPVLGVALSLLVGGVALTGAVRGQDEPAAKPSDPPVPQTAPREGATSTAGGAAAPDFAIPPAAGTPAAAPRGGESDSPPADSSPSRGPGAATDRAAPAAGLSGSAPADTGSPGALPAGSPPGAVPAPDAPAGVPVAGGPPGMGRGIAPGTAAPPAVPNGRPGMMSGSPAQPAAMGRPGTGGPMMGAMGAATNFGGLGGGHGLAESTFGRVEDPEAAKADAKTAGLLHKSIAASMQGLPLDEFLRYVADQTGADIFLDAKALADRQIVPDAPVTLQVREPRSAQSLLELGLRSAGGNSPGYEVSNGLVIVTTRAVLENTKVTRSYDVGKLIDTDPGVDLKTLIQNAVAADTWRAPGANANAGGVIGLFNRKLIVTAAEPNHREIARLLALLAEQPAKGASPGSDVRPSWLEKSLQDLTMKLDEAELAIAEVEATSGPDNPRVAALKRHREILRQQLNARKAELDNAQHQPDPKADLTKGRPITPGRETGGDEGPSSSIKADQLEFRADPNLTITARGHVEVHEKPADNSGSSGDSPTAAPNAANPKAGSKPAGQ
jgi:beta-lactamase regulating signal transducer with metallopeptidase domain